MRHSFKIALGDVTFSTAYFRAITHGEFFFGVDKDKLEVLVEGTKVHDHSTVTATIIYDDSQDKKESDEEKFAPPF